MEEKTRMETPLPEKEPAPQTQETDALLDIRGLRVEYHTDTIASRRDSRPIIPA